MNKKYDKILSVTIKLFVNKGVKKTTMDEISQQANVSKVTIYKYFGDKDALYHKVGEATLSHYASLLKNRISDSGSIQEKFVSAMDVLTDFIASGKLSMSMELCRLNPSLEAGYIAFKNEYKQTIMELINEGKQNNIIKNDIPNEFIYHYIDMGISYFQNDTGYREKMMNDSIFKEEFMQFILQNIYSNTAAL